MYSILFHLLWLSLLEIIFYFEYIGPLETKTYKNTIKRLVNNNNNNNYLIDPYNVSNIINLNDIEFSTQNAQKDREKYNKDLYIKSIYYWLVLLSFILLFYFFIFIYKYYNHLKNKNIEQEIEFVTIRNRTLSNDIELSDESESTTQNNRKFIDYYKIKKTLKKKIIFYILLGILILTFEYLFFNYIVIKYKVLSDDEIINLIYKLINPLLNNIFNH